MEITRNVLHDLLTLYLAGEASEDTRALVERHLREDPALARLAREARTTNVPHVAPEGPKKEVEMKAFLRTRQLLIQHNLFLTLAIVFTVFLAVAMGFLLDTYPQAGAIAFVLALTFWVVFWISGRRLGRTLRLQDPPAE